LTLLAADATLLSQGEQKANTTGRFLSASTMAHSLSTLRSHVEYALAGRVAAPFAYRDRKVVATVSCGISQVDALTGGGLPRGGLTEICGPPCSGRTTLLLSALASRTRESEVCALVDGRDGFDPHSAAQAGVKLDRLLWVRCANINQALRSTDLLLRGGGFGLIALDLSDISPDTVRHVPLNAWFRFRRAVEDTPTVFLLLNQKPNAKNCASLVLRLKAETAHWTTLESGPGMNEVPENPRLLSGTSVCIELLRSRIQPATAASVRTGFASPDASVGIERFETKLRWII
jgi:recombination protein RecA